MTVIYFDPIIRYIYNVIVTYYSLFTRVTRTLLIGQVYVTAVGSLSFSLSTLPLFMEMAIDLVYPSPELLVTAVMIAADSVSGVVFLFLYNIPDSRKFSSLLHQLISYYLLPLIEFALVFF